jgi:hypothetical protein
MKKSKKKIAAQKQIREQLHITNDRGNTFVGCRPCVFADKRARYDRKETRKLIAAYC